MSSFFDVNLYQVGLGRNALNRGYMLKRLEILALITMVLCFNIQELSINYRQSIENGNETFFKHLCSVI